VAGEGPAKLVAIRDRTRTLAMEVEGEGAGADEEGEGSVTLPAMVEEERPENLAEDNGEVRKGGGQ